MFNIGFPELLIILVIALIVFGPNRLPELAKGFGKAMGEFKKATEGMKESIRNEIGDLPEIRGIPKEDLLSDFAKALSSDEEKTAPESVPPGLIPSADVGISNGDVKKAGKERLLANQ